MKKPYTHPTLEEYGKIRDLTHGSTGTQGDFNYISGTFVPANNPTCTNNVQGGICVKMS